MSSQTHKLFTYDELKNYQQDGKWPLADSTLLSTKYADRWQMAEKLSNTVDVEFFKKYNNDYNIKEWNEESIPNKSYSYLYSGDVLSMDQDIMSGPTAWELPNEDGKQDETVNRTKIYFFNWTADNLEKDVKYNAPEEFKYFVEMQKDFQPVLEHYLYQNYADQMQLWEDLILYKLMVIKYNTPSATEKNRTEHRKHNSIRFGDDHCDETLGGLHLGENYSEFWAKNTKTNERNMITELADNKMLWMHGEHAEQSGWIPTYHGMQHNPKNELGDRYSIIMDLQVRYKQ